MWRPLFRELRRERKKLRLTPKVTGFQKTMVVPGSLNLTLSVGVTLISSSHLLLIVKSVEEFRQLNNFNATEAV